MAKVVVRQKGNFNKTERFLERMTKQEEFKVLEKHAQEGVEALRAATPVDTGLTANSWAYEIEQRRGGAVIHWYNTNVNHGVSIAAILQYGHATRNGGYVMGRDYINPAIRPVFDTIAENVWKEVTV